jgi:hypothetical protein
VTNCKSWLHQGFHICPVCKEQFYIPPYVTEWVYKSNKKPVCSYSCVNKANVNKRNVLKGEHYLKTENSWYKKKARVIE